MGVAALVLGIVSLVIGFIPFCGSWAIIPAIVGLVLGIIDWVKKGKSGEAKGKAIAGTICSAIAIIIIISYFIIAIVVAKETSDTLIDVTKEAAQSVEESRAKMNSINWTVEE